jgi:hypothetical protein
VPQLVEQQFLVLPVFAIVEMRDRYREKLGPRAFDFSAFEALDEPLDAGTLCDFVAFPPKETTGGSQDD